MRAVSRLPACAQDRMHFVNLTTCNAVIQCVLSLDDCLDENLFLESVSRVLDSEPILRCQWVERSGSPRWDPSGSDHQDFFRLVPAASLEPDLSDFMGATLDPRVDALVQVRVFRVSAAGATKDTLCVKISHVASDLGGLRYFVLRLAETYGKLREGSGYRPADGPITRGGWQVFQHLSLNQKLRLFRKGKKDFLKKGQWRIPFHGLGRGGVRYITRTADQDQFQALSQYAHRHRATMNQVMLAGFARALRLFTGAEPGVALPLINTLDLRHYLRGERAPGICNLSVPLLPTVAFHDGDTFESTLAQVKSEMLEQKRTVPGVFQMLSIEMLFLAPFSFVRKQFDKIFAEAERNGTSIPVFSDGGPADVKIPGHRVVHAYGTGPVAYAPAFMVTASVFRNSITWATGFCEESISCAAIEHFFDLMFRELPLSEDGLPAPDAYLDQPQLVSESSNGRHL